MSADAIADDDDDNDDGEEEEEEEEDAAAETDAVVFEAEDADASLLSSSTSASRFASLLSVFVAPNSGARNTRFV